MSGADSSSRTLLESTLDRSIEARHRLSVLAESLFSAKRSGLNDRDRAIMLGILGKLVARVEQRLRSELAERLSVATGTPHDLVMALAADPIEWSRPILQDHGVLGDPRLIELAHHRALEHQLTAQRDLLSGESRASGEADAIKALLEDPDGHIAQSATAYLVDQAKRSDGYQEPLIRINELTPDLMGWLCWRTAAALRQHILAHQEIEAPQLDDALERATTGAITALGEHMQPWRDTPAAQLAQVLDDAERATAALMVELLQQGEFALFEALLGQRLQIEPPLLRRIVHGAGGADLALACRALKMSEPEHESLAGLLRSAGGPRGGGAPQEQPSFKTIDADEARGVLRFWQRNPGYQDAIGQLHEVQAP